MPSRIPQNFNIHSIFVQSGGYGNCSFTEQRLKNIIQERRTLKLKDGDANGVMRYVKRRQTVSSNFFYLPNILDDGRLGSIFWCDSRSRIAYSYFNDVIIFDTTYLTNIYKMPFGIFVGVNHHGQSILLGCALLADETIETYEWLFNTFLDCMDNV